MRSLRVIIISVYVRGCDIFMVRVLCCYGIFFFQAEDGIRDLVRSRGLGDVYKRQAALYELTAACCVTETESVATLTTLLATGTLDVLHLSLIHI